MDKYGGWQSKNRMFLSHVQKMVIVLLYFWLSNFLVLLNSTYSSNKTLEQYSRLIPTISDQTNYSSYHYCYCKVGITWNLFLNRSSFGVHTLWKIKISHVNITTSKALFILYVNIHMVDSQNTYSMMQSLTTCFTQCS